MRHQENNLLLLEEQMTSIESDALDEERVNVQTNYQRLQKEFDEVEIPYPDVFSWSTGMDYSDISDIKFKKDQNKKAWEEQSRIKDYINNPKLHIGHLQSAKGWDYYFLDSPLLESKSLHSDSAPVKLINVDDRDYAQIVRMWRFPAQYKDSAFSRNIEMKNFKIKTVDVVFDRSNELLSGITDAYLRKALARNKEKVGVQSIIQTIQQKQDAIRMLPAWRSFIVQGCAGSGKTMVLLHRLRYLLFNKEFTGNDFVFLVPSNHFRTFVKDITANFKINYQNILPVQSYYQSLMEKPVSVEDVSELVFDKKYLARVYSKHFMQECYQELFDLLSDQTNELIDFCEEALNGLLESEALAMEKEIKTITNNALAEADEAIREFRNHLPASLDDSVESVQKVNECLSAIYDECKTAYDAVAVPDQEITISPDDERLMEDPTLAQLKNELAIQQEHVNKATIFTVLAHRRKLKRIQEQYEEAYKIVEQKLIEADKKAFAERAAKLRFVFENVTLEDVEAALTELQSIQMDAQKRIDEIEGNRGNMEEYIAEKYKHEIALLNQMIEASSSIPVQRKYSVEKLAPCHHFFRTTAEAASELLRLFVRRLPRKETEDINNQFKLFASRTKQQLEAYLNVMLINTCKRKIKEEFDIKICNLYKHYWYLSVYCYYLTRSKTLKNYKYLFIDEAQDLSISELELIRKINTFDTSYGEFGSIEEPVMNVFGDVNQMITEHGISTWRDVDFIDDQFELEENFRNTNQVVDFCNRKLTVQMQKIGVDMDEVQEFDAIESILKRRKTLGRDTVLIVKDEYAEADLRALLQTKGLDGYPVYTVKAAKGLEFKEVYVFDRDMTHNEKYIAYTRALAKLTVISTLPHVVNQNEALFVEGEDVTEEGME